jgi:thiomorpholine-carboxylate dehydrogenase
MKTGQVLFLDEDQVRRHLQMSELIPAMESALIEFSAGKVTQPVRSVINVDVAAATGFLGLMPALTPDGLGLKAVTFYPSNVERGIPTHMAMIFLVDRQTGTPLAIMDGRLITEMRTAAVSAAATKLLAPPDAKFSRSSTWCKRSHVGIAACQAIRRNSGVESQRTCRTPRRRWRKSNVTRKSSPRRGCDCDRDEFENASAEWRVAEARLPHQRSRRMSARLARTDDAAMKGGAVFVDSREGVMKESDVILSTRSIC